MELALILDPGQDRILGYNIMLQIRIFFEWSGEELHHELSGYDPCEWESNNYGRG